MTHTSTDQRREKCTVCNGSGTGENGFDCLHCDGDGWVLAEPAQPAAAYTSTEQPWWRKHTDEIELKVARGEMNAATCFTKMLWLVSEASQAQRVALSIETLNGWKRRVNQVATCSRKDERYQVAIALKQDIADVIDGITQEKQ